LTVVTQTTGGIVRDDHLPGVLADEKRDNNVSGTAARDRLSTRHPPDRGRTVPRDRDPDQG